MGSAGLQRDQETGGYISEKLRWISGEVCTVDGEDAHRPLAVADRASCTWPSTRSTEAFEVLAQKVRCEGWRAFLDVLMR